MQSTVAALPRSRQKKSGKATKPEQINRGPGVISVAPAATRARVRARHFGLFASFLICVVVPSVAAIWYLYSRAADQYASTVGFSVRQEQVGSTLEFLGGVSGISSGASSDADILYEFIQSQMLVERVDAQLDLRGLFSKPASDPIFALRPEGSIEDLVAYWGRMVRINYDAATGLIELRVTAFSAPDAQAIARAIFRESSTMINNLSAAAQADAMRHSEAELARAVGRLKTARQTLTEFRTRAQIVDPNADLQGQMGVLNTLNQQLAETLIELDLLLEIARERDPRIEMARRKVSVIEARIADERQKFGVGSDGSGAFSTLITDYEGLIVEREFSESAYLSALGALDAARIDAQRQSRYLAAYIEPTLAETPQYPDRMLLSALTVFFLGLGWSIVILIGNAIGDRR